MAMFVFVIDTVIGLLLYVSGALAMVFGQGLAAIIVFWAVIGGLGEERLAVAEQHVILVMRLPF